MPTYAGAFVDAGINHSLQLIRAEYREMPGLCLTKPQMQLLFGIEPLVCDGVVDALVDARVLRRTASGRYVSYNASRA